MFPDQYFSQNDNGVRISSEQASHFAKHVADDFNPLHDPDAKRFCVPGDLLFALVLGKYGLSRQMQFVFSGMVGSDVMLQFPPSDAPELIIRDSDNREYLQVERSGETSRDPQLIENLTCRYVKFSGQTFPHILVPLMREQGVMINPDRPLVIYENMSIDLDRLDITDPMLELAEASLEVTGKRGNVQLRFNLTEGGVSVGRGHKKMVLSGLRSFDQGEIKKLIDLYAKRRQEYRNDANLSG